MYYTHFLVDWTLEKLIDLWSFTGTTDSISSGPIMNGLVTNGHHKIKCPDITLDNGMDVIEQDIHGISDYSGRLGSWSR